MGVLELLLIAIGLSMDAFAVSVCKGLGMRRVSLKTTTVLALFFGGFQALMPTIGWALGSQFLWLIAPIDHWIAFVLLGFIGGKMLVEAIRETGTDAAGPTEDAARINLGEFLMLAIATSIDALAVGISFAALSVNIVAAAGFIGVITFGLTFAGVAVGHFFGARYQRPASIIGGAVLIFIGLKVLVQHLFL